MDKDIIDERLIFYGLDHFFKRRLVIKTIFHTKTLMEQRVYQWYLYSRPFISDSAKNNMWDYLHGYMSEADFVLNYNYYNKHKIKDTQ